MQKFNYCARLMAIIGLLSLISACGQKGDLYLPDNTASMSVDKVN